MTNTKWWDQQQYAIKVKPIGTYALSVMAKTNPYKEHFSSPISRLVKTAWKLINSYGVSHDIFYFSCCLEINNICSKNCWFSFFMSWILASFQHLPVLFSTCRKISITSKIWSRVVLNLWFYKLGAVTFYAPFKLWEPYFIRQLSCG